MREILNYPTEFYSAYHGSPDDRKLSASGGIATALGKYMLSVGGCVFGTCWDNGFNAVVSCMDTDEGIEKLRGSKYVKSFMAPDRFAEIAARLRKGPVLFIGTPCQVNAVKRRFGDGDGNLFTVDLICHGTPDASAFASELKHLGKTVSGYDNIRFRGNDEHNFLLSFWKDGECLYERDSWTQPYFVGFMLSANLSKACYGCRFARPERCGDITLGDFLVEGGKALEGNGNVSCVSVNTDAGKFLMDRFREACPDVSLEEKAYEDRLAYAPGLKQAAAKNRWSRRYRTFLKTFSPAVAIRLALAPLMLRRKASGKIVETKRKLGIKGKLLAMAMLLVGLNGFAQNSNVTLSGYVRDIKDGESLCGAVVYTSDLSIGVSTNEFGYYSMKLKSGKYRIKCSYTGYETAEFELDLTKSLNFDFKLSEDSSTLEAASIFSKSKREEIRVPQMGKQSVGGELARKLPAIMGEPDIIKVIQMMPGVQSPSEGSTGFSVRGGGIDQNLVLMDGAPLYNSGHMLGFMSMFNGDAIRNAELYKGDFPARYGGRMSSVLDVSTVDGNINEFSGSASFGLITSKFCVEGPIVKSKVGFMLAARRTYLDIFFPLFAKKIPKNTQSYFYDVNAKLNWLIDGKNRLYLGWFNGKDVFGMSMEEFDMDQMLYNTANNTLSLRWNHVFSPSLFLNSTVYTTKYNSLVGFDMTDVSFDYEQLIREHGIKNTASWYINPNNTAEFGINFAAYSIQPGETIPEKGSIVQNVAMPVTHALQPSAFVQNEQKAGPVTLRYGLRFSTFTTTGSVLQRYFDPETHALTDSVQFDAGKAIKTNFGLEPRFSASWAINPDLSAKASYTRTYQYIQQAMISISGGPIDSWFTASPNVKPQISDQFSLGLNALFCNEALEGSVELFYKNNKNTLDLKDNPGFVINDVNREGLLRFGKSYAYGTEIMLKYDFDRLNGWLSYTWSKAIYDIPEINNGKPYRSPLNHEHAVNFVMSYDITDQLYCSADWVFYSGAPTTFPVGRFKFKDRYTLVYSGRNEDSMPDYHRLDLSVSWKTKERLENKRWSGEWNISAYNAYARHNAWSLAFGYNREEEKSEVRKVYLFTIIPSVSYNIKF